MLGLPDTFQFPEAVKLDEKTGEEIRKKNGDRWYTGGTVEWDFDEDHNLVQKRYARGNNITVVGNGMSPAVTHAVVKPLYDMLRNAENGGTENNDIRFSLANIDIPTLEDLESKPAMQVVDISQAKTQGRFTERRKQILSGINEVIKNPYLNKDTNTMIFLTKDSYTHAFSNLNEWRINAAEHLPELVQKAVLTHSENITHGNPNATQSYTFFAAAYNGTEIIPVKLKVKEYALNGQDLPANIAEYFKTHDAEPFDSVYDSVVLEVESIEKDEASSSASPTEKIGHDPSAPSATIKVTDLLNKVNGDARKYIPQIFGINNSESYSDTTEKLSYSIDDTNKAYHAGDLGKSEPLSQMSYSRSSGHYGTGTYFVGDETKINDGEYGNRPHETVDFSKYNLYQARSDWDAETLHRLLRGVNRYYNYPSTMPKTYAEAVTYVDNLRDRADDLLNPDGDLVYDENLDDYLWTNNDADVDSDNALRFIADITDFDYQTFGRIITSEYSGAFNVTVGTGPDGVVYWDDNGNETDLSYADAYAQLSTEAKETVLDEINRKLSSNGRWSAAGSYLDAVEEYESFVRDVNSYAPTLFDISADEAMRILQDVQSSISNDSTPTNVSDSASTRFMKALGYEGVDVRGTSMDNTFGGSVIYDLKDEDLARKNEIGTARFSVPSSQDAAYMDAVNSGDMETAQRMVDEAAKAAGYTFTGFHGTPDGGFKIFKTDRVVVTDNKRVADSYAHQNRILYGGNDETPTTMKLYANVSGGKVTIDMNGIRAAAIPANMITGLTTWMRKNKVEAPYGRFRKGLWADTNIVVDYMQSKYGDRLKAVEFQNVVDPIDSALIGEWDEAYTGTVLFELSKNRVKSADPVTYDDNGDIIPLSQRFNAENNDIRYSVGNMDDARTENTDAYWTVQQGILTNKEFADFQAKIGEIHIGNFYPHTTDGIYILDIGDSLVYTNGDYDNPNILSVVEIVANKVSDRNEARNYLIDGGKMGDYRSSRQQANTVNNFYPNASAIVYSVEDFTTNRRTANGRGSNSSLQANSGSINGTTGRSFGDIYSDEAYERFYTDGESEKAEAFIASRARKEGYRLDRTGRKYVKAGFPTKLAAEFTFDDNGDLIPQSQRINPANDDPRYSVNTDALTADQIAEMDDDVDIALNIRNTRAKFVDRILSGVKTIETRSKKAAEQLGLKIGDKVGIVDTGKKGKPLRGYAEIVDIIEYPDTTEGIEKFRSDETITDDNRNIIGGHFVSEESDYDISKTGAKVGYVLKTYKVIDRANWIPTEQDGPVRGMRSLTDKTATPPPPLRTQPIWMLSFLLLNLLKLYGRPLIPRYNPSRRQRTACPGP